MVSVDIAVCSSSDSWLNVWPLEAMYALTSGEPRQSGVPTAALPQNWVSTSSSEVYVRAPSCLEGCATPMRWVTVAWFSALRPRLVVMITTPLAALEPYSAAAEAPLSTSRVSMSFGLRSAIRLTGLSWVSALTLVAPPAAAAVTALTPEPTEMFDTTTPSTTYSGDDWPLIVEMPRRRS